MKWRNDKPTANVIVAKLTNHGYEVLHRESGYYFDFVEDDVPLDSIEKWADLEEDEEVDLPMWKKSNLPNVDKCGAGVNSENLCYNGYYISYKELFQKLPKEDEHR